jgi:hypothetical protein
MRKMHNNERNIEVTFILEDSFGFKIYSRKINFEETTPIIEGMMARWVCLLFLNIGS